MGPKGFRDFRETAPEGVRYNESWLYFVKSFSLDFIPIVKLS